MWTTTRRKVRADAKLEYLSAAQRERLHVWFEENRTYAEIVRLLREEFGISVGKSAVSVYYRRHMLPEQPHDKVDAVAELAARPAGDFDAATLRRVWVQAFLALARPDPDFATADKLFAIGWRVERHALAVRRRALKARKLALREQPAAVRAAAAERRRAARSEATAVEILRCELPNPPRFPDYSKVCQPRAGAQQGAARPGPETAAAMIALVEMASDGDASAPETLNGTQTAQFGHVFDKIIHSRPPRLLVA